MLLCSKGIFAKACTLHDGLDFHPGKTNKIFHHSSKEHLKNSKISKFGYEML